MKNIICMLAIVFFIIGCEKTTSEIQDRGGIAFLPNETEPFTGKYETYWNGPSSQKNHEGNYKDGKKTGLWIGWHYNGQKANEVNYIDGKRNGLYRSWQPNGEKQYEKNYKDGKLNGLNTFWGPHGQKYSETNESGQYSDY